MSNKPNYDTAKVVELIKLTFPLHKSEVASLDAAEQKTLKKLINELDDDNKNYYYSTVSRFNDIYMIYTADHSYEYARDVKNYEEGVVKHNTLYPMQFMSYENTDFKGSDQLKPLELQENTGFRYSGI